MALSEQFEDSFPRCLFGKKQATRAASRRMCRRAWKDGTWESVFADLETIPFEEVSGWVVYSYRLSRMPWPKLRWNFFGIAEDIYNFAEDETGREKAHKLNVEGMSSLWYTVAMLDSSADMSLAFDQATANQQRRSLLTRYVYWLPELSSLDDNFLHEDLICMRDDFVGEWGRTMIGCIQGLGVETNSVQIRQEYKGDIIRALLDLSVIAADGDRYQLLL